MPRDVDLVGIRNRFNRPDNLRLHSLEGVQESGVDPCIALMIEPRVQVCLDVAEVFLSSAEGQYGHLVGLSSGKVSLSVLAVECGREIKASLGQL